MIFFISCITKSQDSISVFKKNEDQYNIERNFREQFYYNPANMLDYSSSSISNLFVNYYNQKNEIFRLQKGSGQKGFGLQTNSFQRLNDRKVLWGKASYEKYKVTNVKWNENLDYDRVTPYLLSDSVGGNIDIERYHFLGGYTQKFNKFSLGGQASYQAKLGSRSRDPRLNNTTSELNLKFGIGYTIYKKLDFDLFIEGEKYQQNGKLQFVSQLGQPLVYQMTGLGFYSNLFTGGSSLNYFVNEEYSYKTGMKFSNKNGKDFYILGQLGQSEMKNSFKGTRNRYYYISDLNSNYLELEGVKFFIFNKHKIGAKVNYFSRNLKGLEYGYTNNTEQLSLLYKRLSYKRDEENMTLSLFYSLDKENFRLSFVPYFSYQEIKEQRLFPYSGQKFEYNVFGAKVNYLQKLTNDQTISFEPFIDYKSVISAKNALTSANTSSMNDWLIHDFNYLSSDITTIGANLRYDLKLDKLPTFFINGSFIQSNIQSKYNNYSSVSLGITF